MIRSFLAIELDPPTRSALAVQQSLLPMPRKEPLENLHLTLVFLGQQRQPLLEEAHEAFAALRGAAFAVTFAGLGLFGGDRPRAAYAALARNDALMRLQGRLEGTARRVGIAVEARRYIPHVTLGRFRPPPIDTALRLERAVVERGGFTAGPMPVHDIVLYESLLHKDHARHEVLARYPLAPS